jgi:hypothetical protein
MSETEHRIEPQALGRCRKVVTGVSRKWAIVATMSLTLGLPAAALLGLAKYDLGEWSDRSNTDRTFRLTGFSTSKYHLLELQFESTLMQHGQTFHEPVHWCLRPWREVGVTRIVH